MCLFSEIKIRCSSSRLAKVFYYKLLANTTLRQTRFFSTIFRQSRNNTTNCNWLSKMSKKKFYSNEIVLFKNSRRKFLSIYFCLKLRKPRNNGSSPLQKNIRRTKFSRRFNRYGKKLLKQPLEKRTMKKRVTRPKHFCLFSTIYKKRNLQKRHIYL